MLEEHELLKTQKNQVLKILQEGGLQPSNFSWHKLETLDKSNIPLCEEYIIVPRLEYLNGEYYFEFQETVCEFSPGKNRKVQNENSPSWTDQALIVHRWVEYLKREIKAPDLWAEIEKYRPTLALVPAEQIVNEPIPAYEVEEISEKLSALADKIEEQFKLNEDHNRFVRSKLDYLADAAKRQRRRDWEFMFIGVFIAIAFELALEPEKAQQFWQLVKSIVGEFIHLIGS